MNKTKLDRLFDDVKKEAGLDFAITNAYEFGDYKTRLWFNIYEKFGEGAKGIYVWHWLRGTNEGVPFSQLSHVYIEHYITEEQANILIRMAEEHGYDIEPKTYKKTSTFILTERMAYNMRNPFEC